jgi:polyphosphate:AMP phosphotransferase
MLDDLDTSRFLQSSVYKAEMDRLEAEIGVLHRQTKEMGIPIIIVFEGWDASGKASSINRVLMAMDPRICSVHPIYAPNDEEASMPYLWRFWTKIPPKGRIAIFDRSWYIRVSDDRIGKGIKRSELPTVYDHINSFERALSDDGTLIIKVFLHITKKEQERRLKLLQEGVASPWRYLPQNWDHHKHYDEFHEAYEDMLVRTHTKWAPWHSIPAHDPKYATVSVFKTIVSSMEKHRQELLMKRTSTPKAKQAALEEKIPPAFKDIDLTLDIAKDEYERELKELQERLANLQLEVYARKVPVVIAYNGWDASGKGGNIRRLVQNLDPRGYKVIPIIVPTDEEKAHHYMWRFWKELPERGRIAIFDRTWYGRVLVERIEGFCTEEEWKRAYREINEMEAQWAGSGAAIVKFWLHIDKDTQLVRFNERMNNPYKRWKINDEDWRNRAKWDEYYKAAEEMFYRTDTSYAPWTIVEANSKYYSRIKTLRTVVGAIEKRLSS